MSGTATHQTGKGTGAFRGSQAPQPGRPADPLFLQALDHVTPVDDGWIAQCPVWGCTELLEITACDGHWQFACDGPHTHEDVVAYLQLDTTHMDVEATRRLWRAIALAPTLEVCEALLKGQDVPCSRLDPLWLKRLGAWPCK